MPHYHPLPSVMVPTPLMVYPPPIFYKAEEPKKEKKSKTKTVYVPVHAVAAPAAGPTPYPPLLAQPIALLQREKKKKDADDDDDGYKAIKYSGGMIKLNILPKYTKADEVTDGRAYSFRHIERSYMDCLSFKQFVKDFAGKGDKWIITQIREKGAGVWEKAIVIDTSKDVGKKSMADVGWKAEMGPVWVVLELKRDD